MIKQWLKFYKKKKFISAASIGIIDEVQKPIGYKLTLKSLENIYLNLRSVSTVICASYQLPEPRWDHLKPIRTRREGWDTFLILFLLFYLAVRRAGWAL